MTDIYLDPLARPCPTRPTTSVTWSTPATGCSSWATRPTRSATCAVDRRGRRPPGRARRGLVARHRRPGAAAPLAGHRLQTPARWPRAGARRRGQRPAATPRPETSPAPSSRSSAARRWADASADDDPGTAHRSNHRGSGSIAATPQAIRRMACASRVPASTQLAGSRPLGVREPAYVPMGSRSRVGSPLIPPVPIGGRPRPQCGCNVSAPPTRDRIGARAAVGLSCRRTTSRRRRTNLNPPRGDACDGASPTPILADARSPLLRAFRASRARTSGARQAIEERGRPTGLPRRGPSETAAASPARRSARASSVGAASAVRRRSGRGA